MAKKNVQKKSGYTNPLGINVSIKPESSEDLKRIFKPVLFPKDQEQL